MPMVLFLYGVIVLYLALGILKGPEIKLRVHTPSWQIDGAVPASSVNRAYQ